MKRAVPIVILGKHQSYTGAARFTTTNFLLGIQINGAIFQSSNLFAELRNQLLKALVISQRIKIRII